MIYFLIWISVINLIVALLWEYFERNYWAPPSEALSKWEYILVFIFLLAPVTNIVWLIVFIFASIQSICNWDVFLSKNEREYNRLLWKKREVEKFEEKSKKDMEILSKISKLKKEIYGNENWQESFDKTEA